MNTGGHQVRVVTAAVFGAVVAAAVLLLDTAWLAVVFASVAVAASWEWSYLLGGRRFPASVSALALALLFVSLWIMQDDFLFKVILYLSVAWWFFVFILVAAYRASWCAAAWMRGFLHIGMPLALAGAWVATAELHAITPGHLLFLLLLVVVSDIGAYYAGRFWGRRKLIPELSPGKTVAGLWGGLACVVTLATGVGFAGAMDDGRFGVLDFVLLSLLTALIGVVGDLGMSILKRVAGRKNSGVLLPGHGGILDRIDSTLAAAPLFLVALTLYHVD